MSLTDYDLLDEPLAALTDYLFTFAEPEFMAKAANIVVFDFGGGTCDVFVARLKPRGAQAGVDIEAKAVSRYHRLGGSDFDAAIIHEVLIPALLKENNLPARHFEWGDRKRVLEPALRGCAEALKEGLCREIAQLHLHGRYQGADKTTIAAKQMSTAVRVGETEYLLAEPRLTAAKWEELLEPFLSTELLHVRQSDFCQTLSIFAPISDAMERARLPVADVHFVLMAGGSSLIPQVQWAVEKYFPKSRGPHLPGFHRRANRHRPRRGLERGLVGSYRPAVCPPRHFGRNRFARERPGPDHLDRRRQPHPIPRRWQLGHQTRPCSPQAIQRLAQSRDRDHPRRANRLAHAR